MDEIENLIRQVAAQAREDALKDAFDITKPNWLFNTSIHGTEIDVTDRLRKKILSLSKAAPPSTWLWKDRKTRPKSQGNIRKNK